MTGNQTNQTIVFAFLSGWPTLALFYISVGDAVRCGAVGLVHFFESLLPSCGSSLVAARCEICKAFFCNFGVYIVFISDEQCYILIKVVLFTQLLSVLV